MKRTKGRVYLVNGSIFDKTRDFDQIDIRVVME